MVIKNVNLETVCGITSKIPLHDKMEAAFVGRSNVGKSSLINGLMNRKSLARTSSQPGKTQTINFYDINGLIYFVDLPGYGYAKTSKSVKDQWKKMMERYLKKSESLRLVFLLADIRHEPTADDVSMYKWCVNYGYNPVIIATKSDKISKHKVNENIRVIERKLECIEGTPIIPYSSLTKDGRDEIWEYIDYSHEMFLKEQEGNN